MSDVPAGSADACPDAETLAACADGMLDPARRAAVEAHAAGCRDCREILADTAALLETGRRDSAARDDER